MPIIIFIIMPVTVNPMLVARAQKFARVAFSTCARRRAAAQVDSSKGSIHPVYFKLKETQKAYQVDNGLRVSLLVRS